MVGTDRGAVRREKSAGSAIPPYRLSSLRDRRLRVSNCRIRVNPSPAQADEEVAAVHGVADAGEELVDDSG